MYLIWIAFLDLYLLQTLLLCDFLLFCPILMWALLGPIHSAFEQNKLSAKNILKSQMWSNYWRNGSFLEESFYNFYTHKLDCIKSHWLERKWSSNSFSCFCYVCTKPDPHIGRHWKDCWTCKELAAKLAFRQTLEWQAVVRRWIWERCMSDDQYLLSRQSENTRKNHYKLF